MKKNKNRHITITEKGKPDQFMTLEENEDFTIVRFSKHYSMSLRNRKKAVKNTLDYYLSIKQPTITDEKRFIRGIKAGISDKFYSLDLHQRMCEKTLREARKTADDLRKQLSMALTTIEYNEGEIETIHNHRQAWTLLLGEFVVKARKQRQIEEAKAKARIEAEKKPK